MAFMRDSRPNPHIGMLSQPSTPNVRQLQVSFNGFPFMRKEIYIPNDLELSEQQTLTCSFYTPLAPYKSATKWNLLT